MKSIRGLYTQNYTYCIIWFSTGPPLATASELPELDKVITSRYPVRCSWSGNMGVRPVTGNDQDYLRKIPRAVVQISALL